MGDVIEPLRFALRYNPPTLVLEFRRSGNSKKRMTKFQLKHLKATSVSNIRQIACFRVHFVCDIIVLSR